MRRHELRYFNGAAWTADVATGGRRGIDLEHDSPAAPSTPAVGAAFPRSAPGWSDQWLPQTPKLPSTTSTAAVVLSAIGVGIGWIPFLFVVGAIAAAAGAIFAVLALRRIQAGRERGKTAAWWAIALVPLAVASVAFGSWLTFRTVEEFEDYLNPPAHQIRVTDRCLARGDSISYAGTLTNTSDEPSDFTVSVRMDSASGREVRRDVLLRQVRPDESRQWSVNETVLGGQVRCQVAAVYGPRPISGK